MNFIKQYSIIVGSSILIAMIALLLSSSNLFFTSGVSFITTDLYSSSGDEVYVQTKMDFGNNEHMENFPLQIQDWHGVKYDSSEWKAILNADAGVSLGYRYEGSFQEVYLVIVQSKTNSSFHPVDVCYEAQGYSIEERGREVVVLENFNLTENIPSMTIPLAKLVVYQVQGTGGERIVYDRRLVLYCYVRGNQYTSDAVTMIRVSTLIPSEGSYADYLDLEKQFFADALPLMFGPEEKEGWNPMILKLADWGIAGYFIIILMLAIPVVIIVYPKTRWGRAGGVTTGNKGEG